MSSRYEGDPLKNVYEWTGRPALMQSGAILLPGDIMYKDFDDPEEGSSFVSSRGVRLNCNKNRDISAELSQSGLAGKTLEEVSETASKQEAYQDASMYRAAPDGSTAVAYYALADGHGSFSIERMNGWFTGVNGVSAGLADLPVSDYTGFNPSGGTVIPISEAARSEWQAQAEQKSALKKAADRLRGMMGLGSSDSELVAPVVPSYQVTAANRIKDDIYMRTLNAERAGRPTVEGVGPGAVLMWVHHSEDGLSAETRSALVVGDSPDGLQAVRILDKASVQAGEHDPRDLIDIPNEAALRTSIPQVAAVDMPMTVSSGVFWNKGMGLTAYNSPVLSQEAMQPVLDRISEREAESQAASVQTGGVEQAGSAMGRMRAMYEKRSGSVSDGVSESGPDY